MDLRQLECFAAVARHRHFRRAAEALYISQSAVSQQVRRLEEELGLELLRREPGGVELTPAGDELLGRAEAILADVASARSAMDELAGTQRGLVRLATTTLDVPRLARVLATFAGEHSSVRVAVRELDADEVARAVARGAADVGVVASPDAAGEALAPDPLVLVGPPGESLAAGLEELRGRPVVLAEPGTPLRAVVDAACAELGFGALPRTEVSEPTTVRLLVRAGIGVGVVPRSWLDHPGHELASAALDLALPTWLVTPERPTPTAELLATALRRALG